MINLIPEIYRKDVTAERTRRLVIIGALLCIVISITGAILLIPSYILVHARLRAASVEQNQMNLSDATLAESSLQTITKDINEKLLYFPDTLTPVSISDRLTIFTKNLPKGIRIIALRYRKIDPLEEALKPAIEIQGIAATRGILTQYETIIRALPGVVRVESPVTNLLQNRDLDFTLHIYTEYE